jgi:ribonuclease III
MLALRPEVGPMSDETLDACEQALNYQFKNQKWLQKALVHSSCRPLSGVSNERMEFFGDSVLGLVTAEYLFKEYPESTEGHLTKIKSVVVSRPILAKLAASIGLERFIVIGPGMVSNQLPETVLANTFEAVIAAIYIDGGLNAARTFVLAHLEHEIETVISDRHERNYKSLLQQLVQRKEGVTPTYRLIETRGPDHEKQFHVAVVIGERIADKAWGASKKAAEQLAAEKTYKSFLVIYGTKDE